MTIANYFDVVEFPAPTSFLRRSFFGEPKRMTMREGKEEPATLALSRLMAAERGLVPTSDTPVADIVFATGIGEQRVGPHALSCIAPAAIPILERLRNGVRWSKPFFWVTGTDAERHLGSRVIEDVESL